MNSVGYKAAHESIAWRDLSHFGLFRVSGGDAAALLHHLTTNDVKKLAPGAALDAVLVNNKARLLDVLTIVHENSGGSFLVVTSPNRRELFAPHARRFVLYRQDVTIEDLTGVLGLCGLFGPGAATALPTLASAAGLQSAATQRLPGGGYYVWGESALLTAQCEAAAGEAVDGETYNLLRIECGLPAAGFEITEEFNPWEGALDAMISLHKGCYNGQEVIARLNTYKKVKQLLRGLQLHTPIPMGERCILKKEGRAVGFVTSSVLSPRYGAIALGYVRNAHSEPGTRLEVECTATDVEPAGADATQTAVVVALPFE